MIVYDELWMKKYINCLQEERTLINEIMHSFDVICNSGDINSLPELRSIKHDLEEVKYGISKTIDALEAYQCGADSAAQNLQKAVSEIETPTLFKL